MTPSQPKDLDGEDRTNDFLFADRDAAGLACPLGAHIRRANPRDTMPDLPERRSLTSVRRHRLLRRGRPFGPPVAGWPDPVAMLKEGVAAPPASRGIYFVCLNADIEEQFEFVQQRWINDPTFVNQGTDEVDPILGRHRDDPTFTAPAHPIPMVLGRGPTPLRRFVTVKGGEYFFLPSRRALAYLAAVSAARG